MSLIFCYINSITWNISRQCQNFINQFTFLLRKLKLPENIYLICATLTHEESKEYIFFLQNWNRHDWMKSYESQIVGEILLDWSNFCALANLEVLRREIEIRKFCNWVTREKRIFWKRDFLLPLILLLKK